MSYNIISMKLSFLVLSRISFLSLKARVIILYGLPFVNTFFINFYIFFFKHLVLLLFVPILSVPRIVIFVIVADNLYMDKVLLKKLAKKIKELRKINGFSQDDLAVYSGIARSTIGNLETAQNDIVLSKLNKIAKALKVSLSELLDF